MSLLEAHLLCVAAVALDQVSRAWRIALLVRGFGARVSFKDALLVNLFGELACNATPMRVGGEPARVMGLVRCGVPARTAFAAIALEVVLAWPVIVPFGCLLGWLWGEEWWAQTGPRLEDGLRTYWPWVVGLVIVSLIFFVLGRRMLPEKEAENEEAAVERPRARPLLACVASLPLTLGNLVGRTAILPLLFLTQEGAGPVGPVIFGSFALLYSQIVLPTPSGAGPVDFAFLWGATGGDLNEAQMSLLWWWRVYSTGSGFVLGVFAGLQLYGRSAFRLLTPKAWRASG